MLRRIAIVPLLQLALMLACSPGGLAPASRQSASANLQSLADIQLTTASGVKVNGTVIDICEPSGCVGEQVPPSFGPGDYAQLPASPRAQLTFRGPLPQEVTLFLLSDAQGAGTHAHRIDTLTTMPTAGTLNWHFAADEGRYVIEVQALYDTGHAAYVWFPVEAAP